MALRLEIQSYLLFSRNINDNAWNRVKKMADAFDEGFEKGAEAAINTVSRVTGRNIADELYGEVLDRRSSR